MGLLRDLWDEISLQYVFENNPQGKIRSWLTYKILLSKKKIRAVVSDKIYVATSEKAERIAILYKKSILNRHGFNSR